MDERSFYDCLPIAEAMAGLTIAEAMAGLTIAEAMAGLTIAEAMAGLTIARIETTMVGFDTNVRTAFYSTND